MFGSVVENAVSSASSTRARDVRSLVNDDGKLISIKSLSVTKA